MSASIDSRAKQAQTAAMTFNRSRLSELVNTRISVDRHVHNRVGNQHLRLVGIPRRQSYRKHTHGLKNIQSMRKYYRGLAYLHFINKKRKRCLSTLRMKSRTPESNDERPVTPCVLYYTVPTTSTTSANTQTTNDLLNVSCCCRNSFQSTESTQRQRLSAPILGKELSASGRSGSGSSMHSLSPYPSHNGNVGDDGKRQIVISASQPSSPRLHRRKHYDVQEHRHTNAHWEIFQDEIIRINQKIGSGSFGTVYEADLVNHGRVAIKELKVARPGRAQLQAFKTEVVALKKCRHPNIVSFLGYIAKPKLAIVTQWCTGSSLYRHLHVIETKWSKSTLVHVAKQICQAMCYLHSREIIHRDLKSNNILLQYDCDWSVRIGDMGLAAVKSSWTDEKPCRQPTGSILWMAPEIIRMDVADPYTYKSDVYAFGIVLFELTTNTLPYSAREFNRDQILYMVGTGKLMPNFARIPKHIPVEIVKYAQRCCSFNRYQRCSFSEMEIGLEQLHCEIPRIHRSRSVPKILPSNIRQMSIETIAY